MPPTSHQIMARHVDELRVCRPDYRSMPGWTLWICGSCLGLAALMGLWRTMDPQGGSVMNMSLDAAQTPRAQQAPDAALPHAPHSGQVLDPGAFADQVRTLGSGLVEPIRQSQRRLREAVAALGTPMHVDASTTLASLRSLQISLDEVRGLERSVDTRLTRSEPLLQRALLDAGIAEPQANEGMQVWQEVYAIDLSLAESTRGLERDMLRSWRQTVDLLIAHHGAWTIDPSSRTVRFRDAATQSAYDAAAARGLKLWASLQSLEASSS